MCPCLQAENKKIEAYLKNHCGGHIRAAYGCSLGGSFVGLLAARQRVHIDYGILGSSDLDQASPFVAKLQTDLLLPLIYLLPHLLADQTRAVFLAEPVADTIAVTGTVLLFSFQFRKALRRLEGDNKS